MTENTLENRAAFFAQYLMQRIMRYEGENFLFVNHPSRWSSENYTLELTPLSSITDEDAICIANIYGIAAEKQYIHRGPNEILIGTSETSETPYIRMNYKMLVADWDSFSSNPTTKILECYDFLRSRGYLIQWRDLTPDQLISYCWVKVKN